MASSHAFRLCTFALIGLPLVNAGAACGGSPAKPVGLAPDHPVTAMAAHAGVVASDDASSRSAFSLGPEVRKYVAVDAAKIVLEHVRVIDGTGGAPRPDQNVYLADGKITAIEPGGDEPPREGTAVLHLRGSSVIPGIVGMHDHFYYMARPNLAGDNSFDAPALFLQMSYSAPRLYLASGVTTLRTTGSVAPSTDLKLKRAIAQGKLPGPDLDVSGPYLDGTDNPNLQMHALAGPDDARETVAYWADRGVTSFKAYANVSRAELKAAIDEAHKRGFKVTGHLCSVTYEEAVELGIDNLEHGFSANTALDTDKKPDTCSKSGGDETLERLVPGDSDANRLFATLIQHHVAITSTLPGRASSLDAGASVRPAALAAMAPYVREAFLVSRNHPASNLDKTARLLRREMALERAFVTAGGLLLAGADAVGNRGIIPGFGNHRQIELLVEAGFTPVEAIRIATLNGAVFLGRQDRIGSIAVGKNADLVVVKGDPATRIEDIESVAMVFKNGIAYDPQKLLDAVKGHYGEY